METKKILSWDVGIKNLAFCMLQKNNDKFTILKWGIINLVENRQKCLFELRSGIQCSEVAKFCVYHTDKVSLFNNLEGGVGYCCKKHKDKMVPEIIEFNAKKNNYLKNVAIATKKPVEIYAILIIIGAIHIMQKKGYHLLKK
jgi:hypothetical protein